MCPPLNAALLISASFLIPPPPLEDATSKSYMYLIEESDIEDTKEP